MFLIVSSFAMTGKKPRPRIRECFNLVVALGRVAALFVLWMALFAVVLYWATYGFESGFPPERPEGIVYSEVGKRLNSSDQTMEVTGTISMLISLAIFWLGMFPGFRNKNDVNQTDSRPMRPRSR